MRRLTLGHRKHNIPPSSTYLRCYTGGPRTTAAVIFNSVKRLIMPKQIPRGRVICDDSDDSHVKFTCMHVFTYFTCCTYIMIHLFSYMLFTCDSFYLHLILYIWFINFFYKWFLQDHLLASDFCTIHLFWYDSFIFLIHFFTSFIYVHMWFFFFDAIHLVSIWFVLFKWFTNCHMIFTHDSFMIYFFRYVSFLYTWR